MFTFCKARWAKRKKQKENQSTKVTKIPKTKRRKYGMNETIIINQKPYLIANRAVKRMVNQQKFHDTFTGFPGKIWICFNAPAVHDRHCTCCNRFGGFFNFNQAHSAISSNRKSFVVAKSWNFHTNHSSSLNKSCIYSNTGVSWTFKWERILVILQTNIFLG